MNFTDHNNLALGDNLKDATNVVQRMLLNRQERKGLPWNGVIYHKKTPVRQVCELGLVWDLLPISAQQATTSHHISLNTKYFELKPANLKLTMPQAQFDPFEL